MDSRILDELLNRHRELSAFLHLHGEWSLALEAELLFKRAFVVACGSYCEQQLCGILERFTARHGDQRLTAFVRARALERRYHDMFDWTQMNNTNRFWGFFGKEFKESVVTRLKDDDRANLWMRSFVELGQLRNSIAHAFASASVDRTLDELELILTNAKAFLALVENLITENDEIAA